jgi:hypothetical protein
LDKKRKRLNNPDERRKRIHSTLVEFGQMHQLLDTSGGNDKPQQDVDALIKNMVDEKVIYLPFPQKTINSFGNFSQKLLHKLSIH